MQCLNCNATLRENAKFCGKCGVPQQRKCKTCGNTNPTEDSFCSECGTDLLTGEHQLIVSDTPAPNANAPAAIPPRTETERRHVTVVFCDMVGSSELSSRLDPELNREVVGQFLSCCSTEIKKLNGTVASYLGDGILAYFGYPTALEDDAERAVHSSLAILSALEELEPAVGLKLHARIGIASGVVVVGDLVGEGVVQKDAALGETVNLASRLEAFAEPGSVVISPETHELVGGLFEYDDLGLQKFKGFSEPVHVRKVLAASEVEDRFEARSRDRLSVLLGRSEELDLLKRRWKSAEAGEGRVVLVTGEAGIGKSRLTRSLREHLQATEHTLLTYQCSQFHQESALHPFINQLLRSASIEHTDNPEIKFSKLRGCLEHHQLSDQDVALLAEALSIPVKQPFEAPDLTPQQRKERTLRALMDLLGSLCARQSVLLVFEDLHWIDPSSLELLWSIVERASKQRLLLLCTSRPEFLAPWPNYQHVATIALSRLSPSECHDLARDVTAGKSLPTKVLEQIVSRTDGVPLFIEELTKTVLETGMLREAGDRYELTEPLPEMAIPSTLHASLLSRLDRSASAKEVAQIGAAIGREFSHVLLAAIATKPERELSDAVNQLVDTGLVFQRGEPPDAIYQFKHALVQDTAYSSLIRSRRKNLHQRIAKQLMVRRESGEEIGLGILGHHYTEASMIDEAVDSYFQAGASSAARAALSEASALFERALSVSEQLPSGPIRELKELEILCAKGPVLLAERGYADGEVGRTYSRARELWQRLEHPAEFVSVAWGEWNFNINRADFVAATNFAESLLDISNKNQDECGLLLGHCSVGTTLIQRGQPTKSLQHLEEVERLYEPDLHRELVRQSGLDTGIFAKGFQALALLSMGEVETALTCTAEAIDRATMADHAPTRGQCLALAARVASLARSEGHLHRWSSELSSLTREYEYPHFQSQALIFEGCTRLNEGELASGLDLIDQGLNAYQATGATLWSPYFCILKSEALDLNGRSQEALHLLDESIVTAHKQEPNLFTAEIYRRCGRLIFKTQSRDTSDAETRYRKAIEIAQNQSTKLWELRATIDLCVLMASNGQYSEALSVLEPISGYFAQDLDFPDFLEARVLLLELSGKDR